jgi:hypothetical protein
MPRWKRKKAEVGRGKRQKVGGEDERCALGAFHLKSASLKVRLRTECWGLRSEKVRTEVGRKSIGQRAWGRGYGAWERRN